MENNQSQSANGSPVTGKPVTEGPGSEKLNRSAVGVADQLLITLNDHLLDAESAIKENTAQLRVMASSVELVRGIPKKTEAVEKQLTAVAERLEQCMGAVNKLWERIDGFERSTVAKLTGQVDGLDKSVRQLATKPAEWGAEMSDLRIELRRHTELFEKPQVKEVHHRHYLHWSDWISAVLLMVSVGLAWLWLDAREDAGLKASNDLLWRGAWQISDSVMHDKLTRLKTQYDTSSEEFRRRVLDAEAQDEELTQKLKEENIKQQEADEKSTEATEKQREANEAGHEADELRKQKKKR
ncbi:MAG TPA: hypothetical protein VGS79_07660 [Puia sp.]|nr:hypothetical protein [Puia sp.]